jgi:septum formation protein
MLLRQIGVVPDRVVFPDIDESPLPDELPRPYATRMALSKLAAATLDGFIVLAADTVVAAGRRILPKAESPDQVRACLRLLSGRRHRVLTAVALTGPAGDTRERLVESTVTLNRLTNDQIDRYAESGEGEGKAGGYAINGHAGSFVRYLSGSYSGVVGLPLFETAQLLRASGRQVP